jgi:outer membrane biosynthesis protein TonB
MRYARVQQVLEQEDAFVAKMGNRTEAVFKPDGEKQLFSPEVIAVTQAIHNAGKDAHKVHKTEIVRIACQVFRIGRSDPPPVAVNGNGATVDHPAPTPPPAPIPTPQAAPKSTKDAPKPTKATKTQPQKPKAKQAAPSKPPEPPKAEEPVTKNQATPPADSGTRDAALAKTKELLNPERPGENQTAFNAYISIYSMILTALQLTEIYDNQPGREKRFKTLDELAKEVNKFTSIKSAKETQKAQP